LSTLARFPFRLLAILFEQIIFKEISEANSRLTIRPIFKIFFQYFLKNTEKIQRLFYYFITRDAVKCGKLNF